MKQVRILLVAVAFTTVSLVCAHRAVSGNPGSVGADYGEVDAALHVQWSSSPERITRGDWTTDPADACERSRAELSVRLAVDAGLADGLAKALGESPNITALTCPQLGHVLKADGCEVVRALANVVALPDASGGFRAALSPDGPLIGVWLHRCEAEGAREERLARVLEALSRLLE